MAAEHLDPLVPWLGHDPLILLSYRIVSRPYRIEFLLSRWLIPPTCLPARSLARLLYVFCAYGPQAPWSNILVLNNSARPDVEGSGHGRDRGYSAVQCGTMAQAAR